MTSTQCQFKKMYFEVEGEVIGKGRPRFTRQGRTYTPKKTLDYERAIKRAYISKYSYLSQIATNSASGYPATVSPVPVWEAVRPEA